MVIFWPVLEKRTPKGLKNKLVSTVNLNSSYYRIFLFFSSLKKAIFKVKDNRCDSINIFFPETLSCDHTKVSPYYVESIVTPTGFWALPCPNYFMYLIGLCQPEDKDYILMGEDAPLNARGIYYVTTNAKKPYAKGWPGKGPKPKLPGRPF